MPSALLSWGLLALINCCAEASPNYEETLDFRVSTPAARWPARDEDSPYVNWLDAQLASATGPRRAQLLATKGYILVCDRKPKGRDLLRESLELSPRDPRINSMCLAVGAIKVDASLIKELTREEPWKTEFAAAQMMSRNNGELTFGALDPSLDKSNPLIQLLVGVKEADEDHDDRAEQLLRQYVAEYETGPLLHVTLPHVTLATIFYGRGDTEQAIAVLEVGLNADPLSLQSLFLFVTVASQTDRKQQALEVAVFMTRVFDGYLVQCAMAVALHANHEHKKATRYWEQLLSSEVTLAKLDYSLIRRAADSLVRHSPSKAADAIDRYLAVHPNESEREQLVFRAAVYRLLDSPEILPNETGMIDLVCAGILQKTGTPSDRLLGVGALINRKKYELASQSLSVVEREELASAYNNLKYAIRTALEKKQVFDATQP